MFENAVSKDRADELRQVLVEYMDSGQLTEQLSAQGMGGLQFKILYEDMKKENQKAMPVKVRVTNALLLVEEVPNVETGMELSDALDLHVVSRSIKFPMDLRNAIRWFIGGATGSRGKSGGWYMNDLYVMNETFGEYIASFVYLGDTGKTAAVLGVAQEYVHKGTLDKELEAVNATDVTVSLLPELILPKTEQVVGFGKDEKEVRMLFKVSAPISGVSDELVTVLKEGCARVTGTEVGKWRVMKTGGRGNGPFQLDLGGVGKEEEEVEMVRNVTGLVRSRLVDEMMWAKGLRDVRVFGRKRLTEFGGGGGGGVIASTGGTVVASVVGVAIVVLVGGGVLGLLPRGNERKKT